MNSPHERRKLPSRLADSALTDRRDGARLRLPPVAMMPDVKVVKIGGQSIMDRGRAARLPDPRRDRRREGQAQAAPLLRRRHARAPHLLDRERARAADRRARGARRVRPAAERAHAADAARQARRHLHHARRLREAAALLPARLHPDHDRHAAVRLLGEARARAAASREHRTDAGVFLSAEVLGAQARDLHQGRGRPLRRRSEEEPEREAHPAHHAPRELVEGAICPTWCSSASSSSTCTRARFCTELQIVNGLERGHDHARPGRRGCRDDHHREVAARALARVAAPGRRSSRSAPLRASKRAAAGPARRGTGRARKGEPLARRGRGRSRASRSRRSARRSRSPPARRSSSASARPACSRSRSPRARRTTSSRPPTSRTSTTSCARTRATATTKQLYARGRIVMWSTDKALLPATLDGLRDPKYAKIAIANPEHAPYGLAAQQAHDARPACGPT